VRKEKNKRENYPCVGFFGNSEILRTTTIINTTTTTATRNRDALDSQSGPTPMTRKSLGRLGK
jgi:hypothetical protein